MDLDKLTKELLDKKANENNTIDLNAYAIGMEDLKKQLALCNVSKSFPCGDDCYNSKEIEEIYKYGERGLTFYKKKGGVILPRNYEGVDG